MSRQLQIGSYGPFPVLFAVILLLPMFAVGKNYADCHTLRQALSSLSYSNGSAANLTSTQGGVCCDLIGVYCEGNMVAKLLLSSRDLTGTIPTLLFNVTSLNYLDFSNNNFSGSIPEGIWFLKNLKHLDLSRNNLSGEISSSTRSDSCSGTEGSGDRNNCSHDASSGTLVDLGKLQVFDISYNNFSGSIPRQVLDTSRSLVSLNLSHNDFSGNLPKEVGNLQNLNALDFSYNRLSGEIPLSLANCPKLESVMLQHNNLIGKIPGSFVNMTWLKLLNLSFNDLSGTLPTGGIFNVPSGFLIDGNSKLCEDNPYNRTTILNFCNERPPTGNGEAPPTGNGEVPPRGNREGAPTGKSRSRLPKAALAVIVIVVIVLLLLLLLWLFYRNKCFMNKNFGVFVKDISFLKAPLRVTCSDLQTATKGFSSTYLIGSGGIGSVYRGYLEQAKKEVAVKVLKEDTSGDSKSFLEECRTISMITHRNLVKMLTSCLNVDIDRNRLKALVYEFMPNGNLEMWLHEEVVSQAMSFKKWNLNLYQRLSMAIDVASVLSHLHCDSETPMVHGNLKPSNILIAEDMTAHVTDFGMNKFFKVDMIVCNSAGYRAPECSTRSPVSPMWDVYSFGVILLEMFTGKRPTHQDFGGTSSLQTYVRQGCPSNIEEIIDPLLLSEETSGKLTDRSRKCIISILNVALICSKEFPEDRKDIKEALEKLELAKAAFLDAGGNGDNMPHTTFDRLV